MHGRRVTQRVHSRSLRRAQLIRRRLLRDSRVTHTATASPAAPPPTTATTGLAHLGWGWRVHRPAQFLERLLPQHVDALLRVIAGGTIESPDALQLDTLGRLRRK